MFDNRTSNENKLLLPQSKIEPTLTFVVDDIYLAARLVGWAMQPDSSPGLISHEGDVLIRFGLEKDREQCQFIAENERTFFPDWQRYNSVGFISEDHLLNQLIRHPTFSDFRGQTIDSMRRIQNEWQSNLALSASLVHEITGLKLGNRRYDVVITHPAVPQGRFIPPDQIAWAESTSFPLANVVYLWHEILHGILQDNNISHALIERVADHELRKRLTNIPSENAVGCHSFLIESHNFIEPAWSNFLEERAQGKSDILELERFLLGGAAK